jgi:TatD DNase family protein
MNKPMVIHCVRGWEELRRAYREDKPEWPWVLHGFRGNDKLAASLAADGFWFSLGNRGITSEILKVISHDRILLETDESGGSIADVYNVFARTAGYGEETASKLIKNNFTSLFNYGL